MSSKKVLLIAYSFPPRQAIGSQRPYKLSKYLPAFGWDTVILTAKYPGMRPAGARVIEAENRDIINLIKLKIGLKADEGLHQQIGISVSKNYQHSGFKSNLIKLGKEIIQFPDKQHGWYKFAIKSAVDLINAENIDAIISTSYPVTAHLIARSLKQKFNIPWIADLRDPWTQNPYVNKFGIIKYFEKKLEIKTLSDADAIVALTEPWANDLRKLHKSKKVVCITNGYDEDEFPENSVKLNNKLTITYTGMLYNGKRDPSVLFKVVSQLINENKINRNMIEIIFYSPKEDWLISSIRKYNLESVVCLKDIIPRSDVLKKQMESQLLLILLWDNINEVNFCPGKIYEYMGARRPIIAIGGSKGVVNDILKVTNAGKFADNINSLRNILLEYYEEFTQSGEVKCISNNRIDKYNYKVIAKEYSSLLNGIITE